MSFATRQRTVQAPGRRPAGFALALCTLFWIGCDESPPTQQVSGGIVLVVLDTVRADHLSCYARVGDPDHFGT
jgi:hypothetical protein